MTVTNATPRGDYNCNGSAQDFNIPFQFFLNTEVQVLKTDTTVSPAVVTTLALATDYTVTGGAGSTGTFHTVATFPTGIKLSVLPNLPFTQQAHYVPNDPFPAETHEQALDRLDMQDIQIWEKLGRAAVLPPTVSGVNPALPVPVANAALVWDPTGTFLTNGASAIASVAAFNGRTGAVVPQLGDYPASLIPFTQVGGVASTVDAEFKNRYATFEEFGATGNGSTDDTTAIQAALNSGLKAFQLKQGATYLINGGLTCSTAGMTLMCYGSTVKLKNSAGNLGMLTLSGAGSGVYGGTWDGNSANGNATGSIYSSFGVCMDNSNMIVRDTIHLNQYGIGIKGTYKARYMTAEKNNISGTTGYGIYIDGATIANGQTANQTHNRAIGNYIDMTNGGTTGQGILFTGVLTEYQQEYFEVSGNTVIGPQGALGASAINIAVRGNRGIFANNRTKYGSMGISEGGSDTTYTGNIITDLQGTVANGIEPSGANCTITGNTIRNAINGINADTSSTYDGMSIVGNRISASANPIRLQVGGSFTGRNITISGNTLVNSTGNALIYTTNDITNLGICGNTMTGPGSATSGSRGIYINTPLASAQVFASGNKISGVERALTVYSASATTFTDLIAISNDRTSDVGSSSAGWSAEGSAIIGARVMAAYDSDSGGVQRRWLDQANNVFELWGNSFNNPNSNLTAGVGSMYYPTIGNKGAWRKETGSGNTGWVNLNPIASTASTPSLNIPVGVTDSSPVAGDLWNDANGTLNFKGNFGATGYVASNGRIKALKTQGTTYTVLATDETILADATSGAFTITLPASPADGEYHTFVKKDSSANLPTISGNGHNINGSATYTGLSAQYNKISVQYSSAANSWYIVG